MKIKASQHTLIKQNVKVARDSFSFFSRWKFPFLLIIDDIKKIISNNDEYKRIENVKHHIRNRISIFRYYDGDELYRYISFEFQLTCFVPKTRQPPPLSAGVRCCDDKRSYKPALFFNRTEGSYSCNRWLTTLKEKKLISFFFFLVYIEMSLHSFSFFLDLFLLTNMYSLTHCLVARAALTLVFSTRLLLRSFFSSPRITDTYLDRSHVYPLDR